MRKKIPDLIKSDGRRNLAHFFNLEADLLLDQEKQEVAEILASMKRRKTEPNNTTQCA
jgi:hypothetical protein